MISTRMPVRPCVASEGRASDRWGSHELLPPALVHSFAPCWGGKAHPPGSEHEQPCPPHAPEGPPGYPTCKSGCCPPLEVEELLSQLTSKARGNPSWAARCGGSKPGASSNRNLKMLCFHFIATIHSLSTLILLRNIDLIMD